MNVITKEVNYGRTGYLSIRAGKVLFDTSDGEYGPVSFPLQDLEDAIKEYKKDEQQ